MPKLEDLTGQKFGRLTVLNKAEDAIEKSGKHRTQYNCICDCGNTKIVKAKYLKNGDVKSCGCLHKEQLHDRLFEDLTGQKFGRLTVIEQAESKVGLTKWKCQCECGNTSIVRANALKNGTTQSCGCLRREVASQTGFVDLTGRRFGMLSVMYQSESKFVGKRQTPKIVWHCKCDCGNEVDVIGENLKVGTTTSCGCKKYESRHEDLTGQKFGRWTVLFSIGHASTLRWHCKCDCGNEGDVPTSVLKHGLSLSCGCLRNEWSSLQYNHLEGIKFGMLLAIEPIGSKNGNKLWRCKCDCGNECNVVSNNLVSGTTTSCGCRLIPRLEQYVLQYFDELGLQRDIDYCTQKKFDDLRGLNGYPLSYDFAIYDNNNIKYLVECQGVQHYQPVGLFGGEEQFEIQQFHDELKAEYAKSNGYELIEIPYTINHYDDVKQFLDSILI